MAHILKNKCLKFTSDVDVALDEMILEDENEGALDKDDFCALLTKKGSRKTLSTYVTVPD